MLDFMDDGTTDVPMSKFSPKCFVKVGKYFDVISCRWVSATASGDDVGHDCMIYLEEINKRSRQAAREAADAEAKDEE